MAVSSAPQLVHRTFPFVVGCPRSGTTLVQAMLNAHPEIAVPFESHFIVPMAINTRRYAPSGRLDIEAFVAGLAEQWAFQRWNLPDAEIRAALNEHQVDDYADAVRLLFALYAANHDKQRYADKTPLYVNSIPLLASLFPEAVFIHIIRDGRDVALSQRDAWFGTTVVEQAAVYWASCVESGRRASLMLPPHRYCEIRYEHLLEDVEKTMRDLCDFVQVTFESKMLDYIQSVKEFAPLDIASQEHRNLSLPPTKGLRDWKRQMSKQDIKAFELLAGDVLEQFGYETESS